ncbi:ABC transporter ATP-binding protein [Thalassoglobus polymorphus]|uniref:Putative ABC transporter ATP-binding protein n=1 Tax=Thalassoglobus polymorphus TaxID=2527994 RepID=A0A517QUI1_9PLAN|nr:ABC transporter ATP-binding protein [Thalassoglobus polymorphus]QDT35261.1 putative ABC transporter ATP-binding protein [Thalassoglobus polymorphus]
MSGDGWIDEDDLKETKLDLRLWKTLIRYTLHYRRTSIVFVFVAFTLAASDLGFPLLTGLLIQDIEADPKNLNFPFYIGMFAFLSVSLSASICAFVVCAGKIRTSVSHDIRRDAFQQLQRLSFSYFDTRPTGWLMARLTSDCQRLSVILAWGVMDFIWGTTLMTSISVVMVIINWKIALAIFSVIPILFLVSLHFKKKILRTSRLVRKTNSRITGVYNEGIMGVQTSKIFVREEENLRDFDLLTEEMFQYSVRNAMLSAVYLPLVLTLGSVAIAAALVVGGHQAILGNIAIGEMIMFMYFAQLFFTPAQEISAWFAELQMAQASAERVLSLIESVPDVKNTEAVARRIEQLGSDGHPTSIGKIEFRDVSFAYQTGPQIIRNFSLTVEPGETIALVGATGGGKSTMVNLLCRFYEPTGGQILIDDVDYTDRSLEGFQSQLGIVLQQPHLFSGTIAENIRYGKLSASDAEVEEAARFAGAHEFISVLEDGYQTPVGEGGNQLSLGQKQLVSFARTVLKRPQLLVMDEATSSIDTETEQLIQNSLKRILKERTSFVIAHRLSTIQAADRILVINNGEIVEQGSHQELLKTRGHYFELYKAQAIRDLN